MRLKYVCRYCKDLIGSIRVNEMDEEKLGFTILTEKERKDIIKPINDELTEVTTICDYCADERQIEVEGNSYLPHNYLN